MAYLYSETIKSAFADRLKELFPNVAIFKEKEEETNLFPNFYILQLTLSSEEDRKDHYFLDYYITVRYRQVADINTEPKLQQKLDEMGFDLIDKLTSIPVNNKPVKLRNCNYEKIDGVVHFFANVQMQIAKEKPIEPLMETLELNTEIITEN